MSFSSPEFLVKFRFQFRFIIPDLSKATLSIVLNNNYGISVIEYNEKERKEAIGSCGKGAEITRFKGLGEISPNEFKHFIGDNIRLDPIMLDEGMSIEDLLSFYMGKNTPDRQNFIIDNLKVELDLIDNNK